MEYNPFPILSFKKLSEHASEPVRGSDGAAGFDLASAHDYVVKAKDKQLVMTDLSITVPSGCYGRIAPRSGLAVKHFIDVGAGVVDKDFRGNVGILLYNFGYEDFEVRRGDRVAQLICEKIEYPQLRELRDMSADTQRGESGFGSTGISILTSDIFNQPPPFGQKY